MWYGVGDILCNVNKTSAFLSHGRILLSRDEQIRKTATENYIGKCLFSEKKDRNEYRMLLQCLKRTRKIAEVQEVLLTRQYLV